MFLGLPVSCSDICQNFFKESGTANSVAEPSLSSRRQLAFSNTLGTNTGGTSEASYLCTSYDQIVNIFVELTKYFSIYYLCKRSIGESYHKINDLYIKKLCFVICTEKQCFVYIFNKPHKLFTFIMAIEIQTNCDICTYKL